MAKVMSVSDAVREYIKDGSTITFGGFIGSAHPEEVSLAIENAFLETGHPANLSLLYCAGMGDSKEKGLLPLLNAADAMPQTIVLNRKGEVTYNAQSPVTYEQLAALYDEAQ